MTYTSSDHNIILPSVSGMTSWFRNKALAGDAGLGGTTTTKVLMHRRRISMEALRGDSAVWVCGLCHDAFKGHFPKLSKFCLANWLWLGRHTPLLREAGLGHQLLLSLGRLVSTKVYLSSKGRDESVKQHGETWRQRFLQRGMQGTAILFGRGSADDAMRSFPPSREVCQAFFVAVFTGPEEPTPEERQKRQCEDRFWKRL